MDYYEIPTTAKNQRFYIALGGVDYQLAVMWRDAGENGGWFLDVADSSGNALVNGIPLVTGVDLLAQYPDKGFGGALYVSTDGDPLALPTYSNLGTQSHLYFGVES